MSQTLTYVMGSDRRTHVDNIQDFKVDFSDNNHNWVQARQFERGMRQVFVNVTNEDGTPFDLTGCNVWFEGLLPKTAGGDFRVIDSDGYVPLDPSAGKFRFDMPGHAFTVAGSYRQAFFRIVKNGNSVTTLEFDLDVLADKVIDGLVPKNWIGPFENIADQLVDSLQKHTDDADKILADFQKKVGDLITQLNQQGSTTTSMLTELQNRIADLEEKIKRDNLVTQPQLDAFKQTLESEIADLNKQVTSLEANTPYFKLADYKTGTNSWQDAVDAVLALKTSAYNIALPKDQAVTTDITISKPGVSLIGGVLSGAQLILDYPLDSNENTMCSVDHVRFTGGNDGIKIIQAPYVRIANCYFRNTGVGIRIASDVNKDGFQPSRRLIITGNHFNGCSYGLYSADATNQFGASGDVVFTANQVDVKIGGIHSENVDGHTITNNVFYMPGNSDRDMNKLDNIYLQNAHFTVIQGNSCFEAGRNGIRLIDCTNVSVLDNQIDWPGQNTPASGIYFEYSLSGEIMGRISGNQIVYPTKYGIETPATNGMLDVSDNMIVATGDGRYYCGSESLDNYAPHYNVYAPNMNGSKFSGNMAFAVNNNQSQWNVNNVKITSNYLSDILNYSDRVSVKDFSRSNIVYRAVLHQTLSASYQMTKDDFNTKVGGPDVGAYLIYVVPWAKEATVESYIAAYSGGITTQSSLTKTFSGESKTQISVDGDTIKFTGTGLVVITAI